MQNEENIRSTPSSYSSDVIRKHLDITHKISETAFENSSIFEFIQTKSRELLICQEKMLEMEAQIKILRETLSLQSAEFSFQQSEYEKEIEQLKKKLELHIGSEVNTKYTLEDENHKKLTEEIQNLKNKYSKWKEKAKSEKSKFEETDAKLAKNKDTLKIIVSKYRILYSRYKSLQGKSNTNEEKKDEDTLLTHIEIEREAIYDMLNIDHDDVSGKWLNLSRKCNSMIQQVDDLEKNNDKLSKQLTNALDTIKQLKQTSSNIDDAKNNSIENINSNSNIQTKSKLSPTNSPASSSSLHSGLPSSQNIQNSVLTPSSPKQQNSATSGIFLENKEQKESEKLYPSKCRSQIIISLDKFYFNCCKQLNNLHDALIPNERTNIRSIFLSVIFIIRFKHSFSLPFDPTSLSFFYGREDYSTENKVKAISQKFTELTRDLLVAKQNLVDCEQEKDNLINQLNEINEQKSSKDILEAKISCYKKRMIELQEYLSTLISPEQYQEARIRIDHLEEENRELQDKFKSMQKMVDDSNYNSIEITNQIENLKICADVKSQEAHEMRLECASKDDKIEALNAIIHEKTKEIVSLEKMLNAQKIRNDTASSNIESLTIENQNLLNEQKNGPQIKSNQINPAFLVKSEKP